MLKNAMKNIEILKRTLKDILFFSFLIMLCIVAGFLAANISQRNMSTQLSIQEGQSGGIGNYSEQQKNDLLKRLISNR